jgi:Protein of unknown function (DUF3303)
MKYAVSWTTRLNGSAEENEAAGERLLALYSKWSPPASATYHQFLSALDGRRGLAIIETDNPEDVGEVTSKMAPYLEFHIEPVVDIANAIEQAKTGVDFRNAVD